MTTTKIQWADKVWNPVVGCSVASPGCKNCYAVSQAHRHASNPKMAHYAWTTAKTAGTVHWTGEVNVAPDHILLAPLKWKKPQLIFVNSMSDLFHKNVSEETLLNSFAVMLICRQHIFLILTKRSARMKTFCDWIYGTEDGADALSQAVEGICESLGLPLPGDGWNAPLPNIWMGVSVEDQRRADERIPDLLATPAAVRWISAEPLLGPVSFRWLSAWPENAPAIAQKPDGQSTNHLDGLRRLDWVVVGGESGHKARPMHPDWARDLRDQCAEAGVPFFYKQWGEWAPGECCGGPPTRTERCAEWFNGSWHFGTVTPRESEEMHRDDEPDVYRIGRKAAGNHLDGVEHLNWPRPHPSEVAPC